MMYRLVIKGHSAPFCRFFVTSKTSFGYNCISDSIGGCLLSDVSIQCISIYHKTVVAGDYVNTSPFEEWSKVSAKTQVALYHSAIKSI